MADGKLSNETQFLSANNSSTDSKPKLENMALFRANYMTSKYSDLEDLSSSSDSCSSTIVLENKTDSCSPISVLENQTTTKLTPDTKLCTKAEKPVINYVPSIRINVANLPPERGVRSPMKNADVIDEKSLSECKDKAMSGKKKVQSLINRSLSLGDTSTNTFSAVVPQRGQRRSRKHPKDYVSHDKDKEPQFSKKRHASTRVMVATRKRRKPISPHSNSNYSVKKNESLRSVKNTPANDTSSSEFVDEQHQCNICRKMYSSLAKLQNHMHWHVTKKMFRCGLCKKIFKGFSHYIRHQQMHSKSKESQRDKAPIQSSGTSNDNTHPGKPQRARKTVGNKCSICLRTFSSLGRLRLHQVVHQKGDRKPFKCYVCGKKFVYFGKIKKHALKFHNIAKLYRWQVKIQNHKLLKCTTCGKTFNSRHDMQIHERLEHDSSHHNVASTNSKDIIDNEQQRFKCGTCDKNFKLKRTLLTHQILHTGVKPFTCHICNKSFTWRSSLLVHFKSYHKGKPPYKCDKCGSLFKMCVSLRRHECVPKMSSCTKPKVRKGRASYKCSNCDRRFSKSSSLRMHKVKVHRNQKSEKNPHPSPHRLSQSSKEHTPTSSHDTQSCKPSNSTYSLRSVFHQGKVFGSLPKPQVSSSHKNSPKHTAAESFSNMAELQTHEYKEGEMNKSPETVATPQRRQWILVVTHNGRQMYRCGLCTHSERNFAAVSSVRKHVGMIHRDFTDLLVEPPGLYDNVCPEQTSTSSKPSTNNTPQDPSPSSCTCKVHGMNDKLSHIPSHCPVHKTNQQSSTAKDGQTLKCKHCDEEFDRLSREKFMQHELAHELEATEPMGMMYACFECDQEFALASDLMDHHATAH